MLLAALDLVDYAIMVAIAGLFAGGAVALRPSDSSRLNRIERKLDLLLKHFQIDDLFQIDDPSLPVGCDLSPEVRQAADSGQKIEAIRLYREQAGVGLKEAKDAVDAYLDRRG